MSIQHQEAVTRSFNSERPLNSSSLTEALLRRMLRELDVRGACVDTPAGDRLVFGGDRPGPQARLTIHSWRCLWRLASRTGTSASPKPTARANGLRQTSSPC